MGPLCVPCAMAFAAWSPRLLASSGPHKKSSCGWAQRAGSAQGAVPRGLAGSAAVIGCFSDQPDALTCHRGRGHAATLASEGEPEGRKGAPPVGSDDATGGRAVSRRCGGFAQSCGWCCSFDRARSDPCSRHQHGSCGRSFVRLVHVDAWAVRRSTNDREAQSPWRGVPLVCDTEPVWRGCPCVAGVLAGV